MVVIQCKLRIPLNQLYNRSTISVPADAEEKCEFVSLGCYCAPSYAMQLLNVRKFLDFAAEVGRFKGRTCAGSHQTPVNYFVKSDSEFVWMILEESLRLQLSGLHQNVGRRCRRPAADH